MGQSLGGNTKGMRELRNIRREKERHDQRVPLETRRTVGEEEYVFPSEPRNLKKIDPKHRTKHQTNNNKLKQRWADLNEFKNKKAKIGDGPPKRKVGLKGMN